MLKYLLIASLALVFTPQAAGGNWNGHPEPHPTTTSTAPTTTTFATKADPPPPGNLCPTGNPVSKIGFANGYRYGQLSAADRVRYMDEFAATGAKWFRMNLENWSLAEAQDVIAKARQRGFCVIGNLNANPSGTHWANPPSHQAWADAAVNTFVKPLINDVTVWEIWNEPNLTSFFSGNSDQYADLLHTAYLAIHQAQPEATVLTAGLAPVGTGTDPNNAVPYWKRVYNWNARQGRQGSVQLFDALSHHAYLFPEDPTDHANDQDWSGFYQAKLIHDLMVSKGDGAKKVWGTETGAPSGCTYAQCITIAEAARRLPLVMQRWNVEWGDFTGPLMWHELQEQPDLTGVEHYFGFIRGDWSHKEPLWTAYHDYASSVGAAALSVTPTSLAFGTVAVGAAPSLTFTVANTGGSALTVTSVGTPAAPFTMTGAPAAGATIAAGQSVTVTVTLRPTQAGSWSSSIPIVTSAGSATVTLSGTTPAAGTAIPAPWAGGWQINTRAALSGSSLVVTPNVGNAAGSAFWRTAVPSSNLSISFDATIDQGTGADGLTLALANASTTAPTAVGAQGGGLGFAGIQGVAVALDTWQGAGEPSNNFVGVAPTSASGVLTYSATSTNVPSLRNSTHHVDVAVLSGRITVKIDGVQRLDTTVSLPPNVLVGFTAGTGGATDRHLVTNFVARYGDASPPAAAVLSVTPTSLAFGTVAVGAAPSLTFAVANTGGSALTVTSVGTPAAPFTMTGAPAAGATIAAGQSVTVTVTLRPTQTGSWSSSIPIVTSAGSATVTLSGTTPSTPPAVLSVTPTSLAFGTVAVGAAPSLTFTVANTGGSALTVTSVGTPAAPFTMTGAPAAGATIAAGQSVTVTVTLRPTQTGSWSSSIPIVTSAGSATVALSGTTPAAGTAIPAPWAGGWQINTRAALSGSALVMTPNVGNVAGTAFWPTAVPTGNLRASFDLTIDQGSGADGATFILGDPTAGARPTSIGGSGGALGAAGIPGVAVTFDTYDNGAADPSANFIGVARTGSGLAYDRTATNIPTLRNATHHIDIAVSAGHLTVAIDGAAVIDSMVALPATAFVGFGAATGGLTDRHMVTNVVLNA